MIAILLSLFLAAVLWAVVLVLKLPTLLAAGFTAAVALVWIASLALRLWRARKAAAQIDRALQAGAEAQARTARPDEQEQILAFRAEFEKAVQALKASKLARGGRNALAVLPWYLMIGPSGVGKTRALLGSELKFPYLSRRGGVRGMGGTRNCDWFLANEAVLLDTAGRYATEDQDHDEWMAFLEMLRKARPRKPVNGVLLAISITDVTGESEEGAARLGRELRERIDEVMSQLRLVLPVYVIFTKCDLLPGFVETFADLRKAERGQVLGFTLPLDEDRDRAVVFGERLDTLLGVVEERSLERLGEERRLPARELVYQFPEQLAAGRAALSAFVDGLFAENVYQDAPILRGVYFTSAVQEGRVVDRLMARLADAYGIRAVQPEVEPVVETRSFFLRDVFAKVIIPDQGIAFRHPGSERRERRRRWIAAGAAGALALLATALAVRSFERSRELVASTDEIVRAVAERLRAPGKGHAGLAALEPLRERYAMLERAERDGAPWGQRLGLYRGGALLPHLRRFYAVAVGRLLIDGEFKRTVADLDRFAARLGGTQERLSSDDHGRYYELLKLHLLLSRPRAEGEPEVDAKLAAWIGRTVAQRWAATPGATREPLSAEVVARHAEAYGGMLAEAPQLAMPRHEQLVRKVRRVLWRLPSSTLDLQKLVAELDDQGYDLTLDAVLRNASVPSLGAGRSVRGAFTRRAYEEVVKKRLSAADALSEEWVLSDGASEGRRPADDEREQLRSKYHEAYRQEWREFLRSIVVGEGLEPMAALQDLTQGSPSPLALVFRAVGYNARIAETGVVDELQRRVRSRLDGLQVTAVAERARRRRGEREAPLVGAADVERDLARIAAFGEAPDESPRDRAAPPPRLALDRYEEQLTVLREALRAKLDGNGSRESAERARAALAQVRELVGSQDEVVKRLILPPAEAALKAIEDPVEEIARGWCSGVVERHRSTLDRRYPFARDGDDAALVDVAEFFRPATGTLWAFYDKAMRREVPPKADGTFDGELAASRGLRPELAAYLGRAMGVTRALFPAGAAEPRAAFSVDVLPTSGLRETTLTVNGASYTFINGPEEWHAFTWPGEGKARGASLSVVASDGRDERLQGSGEWGLFRLLELGTLGRDPRPEAFEVTFRLPNLERSVTVKFRVDGGAAPFLGRSSPRLLDGLRAVAALPVDVGRAGGACR